jgi:hypothetical protein
MFLLASGRQGNNIRLSVALMVAPFVVMYDVLLQRSPQGRFSKQDQPRQTFFFDRPHPSVPHTSSDSGFLLAIEADSRFPS